MTRLTIACVAERSPTVVKRCDRDVAVAIARSDESGMMEALARSPSRHLIDAASAGASLASGT
jgi:hypothetical protein